MPPRPTGLARLRAKVSAWAGEQGSQRRTIARNSAWETGSYVVYAVVLFFLSPFIVHQLGNSQYGIWQIVISLTGFLGFAELGVRPAAVHYIARYDAQKDYDALNRYVNTAFVTFAASGLVVLTAAVPLALLLPRVVNMAPGFETQAGIALVLVAAELALSLPLNAFSAVLVGKQRYDRLCQIRIASVFVRTGLIVIVLSRGWGLVALALVHVTTGVVLMLAYTVSAFRLEPHLRFAPRLASRGSVMSLLRFGGWAVVVSVGLQLIWFTDSLVIGIARSDAAVAFFAIGFMLPYQARDLLRVMARVIEPTIAALHGLGDQEGILQLLTKGVRIMLLFAGPIIVYLVVVGQPFLRLWQSPEHALGSSRVLVIFALAVVPVIASSPLFTGHYGTNRLRPLALLTLFEAALNLGLSIALVGPYGIEGVALGTAIPAWLVHGALLPWVLCRHYGLSWSSFLVRTWTGPLLAATLPFVVLRLLVDPAGSYGWITLFGLAGLSVVLYGLAALALHRLAPGLMGTGSLLRVEAPGEGEA